MDDRGWKNFREMVSEGQEVSFVYKGEEWWISRLYNEEKSYLLTRSKDSYTQEFETEEEVFAKGMVEGRPLSDRKEEIDWE